jgi:outer membrane protein assembly factor BamB
MKPLLTALAGLVLLGCAAFLYLQFLLPLPQARSFPEPPKTDWRPGGPRAFPERHAAVPLPDTFHTMHGGLGNTDEVDTAAAPMFAFDWVAEEELYVPEGPTFDREGNLYFSPTHNAAGLTLVSLDAETGARRWAIEWPFGGGAPLVLDDPEDPGKQVIYHCSYDKAWAVKTDGDVVWEVETGLEVPPVAASARTSTHCWGMNYHPQADAVTALTMDAKVYVLDRRTGRPLLSEPFQLPGAPTPPARQLPPERLLGFVDSEMESAFGPTRSGAGRLSQMVDVLFGDGFQVSNYYAIDSNTGRLFIAATAPDAEDGKADGFSELGAIYGLDLVRRESGAWELEVGAYQTIQGGTGSTPSVKLDGSRVVVSDSSNHLIVLDAELKELWRLDVGEQIAASVSVSSDNDELYVVTGGPILKVVDHGSYGEIAWRATLDAYPETGGIINFNTTTATITPNGIAIGLAGGYRVGGRELPFKVGAGLLDRDTGELRYFAEGREESIAVSCIGPDGAFYFANSPVRRAITRALLPGRVPSLVGGISRYKPVRHDLVVRDASCAAAAELSNAMELPGSAESSVPRLRVLVAQAGEALRRAPEEGVLPMDDRDRMAASLAQAEARLAVASWEQARLSLQRVCEMFE